MAEGLRSILELDESNLLNKNFTGLHLIIRSVKDKKLKRIDFWGCMFLLVAFICGLTSLVVYSMFSLFPNFPVLDLRSQLVIDCVLSAVAIPIYVAYMRTKCYSDIDELKDILTNSPAIKYNVNLLSRTLKLEYTVEKSTKTCTLYFTNYNYWDKPYTVIYIDETQVILRVPYGNGVETEVTIL